MIKWARGMTWDGRKYWCRGSERFGSTPDWQFAEWEVEVDPETEKFVLFDMGIPVRGMDEGDISNTPVWKTSWFTVLDEWVDEVENFQSDMPDLGLVAEMMEKDLTEG